MQIKSVQRSGIIGEVRLPETGQVSAQRKVAPIRDTYEDGSRRYEPLMKPASDRQPQGVRFSGAFDLHKFFLAILLQQGRVETDSDFNEQQSISKRFPTDVYVKIKP
jgi:hypothetical protein